MFTGLFAAFMLMSAIPDLVKSPEAVDAFRYLGYPQYLILFIGIAKVLGVLAVLVPGFPRLKEWAYAGLCFDLVGALYSAISVNFPLEVLAFPSTGLVLLALSYIFYHKRKRLATDGQLRVAVSEAFAKGDLKTIQPFLADNITWNILGESPVTGKDEVIGVLRMSQLQSFPDITVKSVVNDGSVVVIESAGKATTTGGKPYNQTYCDIYRFSGNKLVGITTYLDTALSNSVAGR